MGRVAASDPEPGVLRAAGPEGTRAQNGKGHLTSGERERARTAVAPLGSERPPGCPRKEVRPLGEKCARGSEMLTSETKAGGAGGHAPPQLQGGPREPQARSEQVSGFAHLAGGCGPAEMGSRFA